MTNTINEQIVWAKTQQTYMQTVKCRHLSEFEEAQLTKKIKQLLQEKDAVLVAHYYVDSALQILAEQSGGFVGDSLEMARFGKQHPAKMLVVSGVRFMGETAKILSPEKHVHVVDFSAECSLDLSAPVDTFEKYCDKHPERTVVVYANTSAAVKARADWVVTSSNAVDIVSSLKEQGKKLIWAPDRHLGTYIRRQTGADMLIWEGTCVVHDAFKSNALRELKSRYPAAAVLVHPESPADVIALADAVGSTTALLNAAKSLPNSIMIVATDNGILHKMKQVAPGKTFIEAPTAGLGATCESCAHCPWMALNSLEKLQQVLLTRSNEVFIDENTRKKAYKSTYRMIEFSKHQNAKIQHSIP